MPTGTACCGGTDVRERFYPSPTDAPGAANDVLINWLELEVKEKLSTIVQKLDFLALRVDQLQYVGARPVRTSPVQHIPCELKLPRPRSQPRRRDGGVSGMVPKPASAVQSPPPTPISARSAIGKAATASTAMPDELQGAPRGDAATADGNGGDPADEEIERRDPLEEGQDIACDLDPRLTPLPGLHFQPLSSHITSTSTQSEQTLGSITSTVKRRTRMMGKASATIWTLLEDQESGPLARCYAIGMPSILLISVLVSLSQTTVPPLINELAAAVAEVVFDLIYLMEIIVRFTVCPNRVTFFKRFANIIDMVAPLSLFLRAATGFVMTSGHHVWERPDATRLILLFLVPILRLLKGSRHSTRVTLLVMALRLTLEALPTLLFSLSLVTLVFSTLIFIVEPRDNIPTLPRAIWLSIVTMTTVGYGDTIPKSSAGYSLVCCLVIFSVLFMAMPLGMIGYLFTEVWKERDRILLAKGMRDRLVQMGYTAEDIPKLFRHFDDAGVGEIDFQGFRQMIQQLRLGLKEERIMKLFTSIDRDNSGAIDDREFVRTLFPGAYFMLYGVRLGSVEDDNVSTSTSQSRQLHSQKTGHHSPAQMQRISSGGGHSMLTRSRSLRSDGSILRRGQSMTRSGSFWETDTSTTKESIVSDPKLLRVLALPPGRPLPRSHSATLSYPRDTSASPPATDQTSSARRHVSC